MIHTHSYLRTNKYNNIHKCNRYKYTYKHRVHMMIHERKKARERQEKAARRRTRSADYDLATDQEEQVNRSGFCHSASKCCHFIKFLSLGKKTTMTKKTIRNDDEW